MYCTADRVTYCGQALTICHLLDFILFEVLCHFKHCTGHIRMGSFMERKSVHTAGQGSVNC